MAAVSHRFVVMLTLMRKRCLHRVAWPCTTLLDRWVFSRAASDHDVNRRTRLDARRLLAAALLLCGLSLAPATSVLAAEWEPKPAQSFSQSEGISPARAAALVRSSYGGRVLSAAPASRGGSSGVVVRVLIDDGARVKTVFVDARGRMRAGR